MEQPFAPKNQNQVSSALLFESVAVIDRGFEHFSWTVNHTENVAVIDLCHLCKQVLYRKNLITREHCISLETSTVKPPSSIVVNKQQSLFVLTFCMFELFSQTFICEV